MIFINKIFFGGIFITICCLFFEVEETRSATDIGGKCIKMNISPLVTVTPDDVCRAAGHGSCINGSVGGSFGSWTDDSCTGIASGPVAVSACNSPRTIMLNHKSVMVGSLVCNIKSWGSPPQPDNVPGNFEQSIKNTTDWILGFVGMIAVLMIIWGGVGYLTSAGDEDKAKTGKRTIQYAVIGLVIAGIAYAIVNVIITVIL